MSSFWSDFAEGFVPAFQAGLERNRKEQLIREERQHEMKRSLLELSAKQGKRSSSVSQNSSDLAWLKSRVGTSDKATEFLSAANLRPDQVTELRKTVESAERNIGKRLEGDEFVSQVSIVGLNLNDPSFVQTYMEVGDPYEAALRLAQSDEDITEEQYLEALYSSQTPQAPVSFEVNPELYKEPMTLDDYKKQADIFQQTVVDLARKDLPSLSEGDVSDFSEFKEKVDNYGKDFAATSELNEIYFQRANEYLSGLGLPTLESLDQNPYIAILSKKETPEAKPAEDVVETKPIRWQGTVTEKVVESIPELQQYLGQSIVVYNDRSIEVVND